MPFATVKSNPYKAGLKVNRKRSCLWPDKFWQELVEQAKRDDPERFSNACFEMICDINARLYG